MIIAAVNAMKGTPTLSFLIHFCVSENIWVFPVIHSLTFSEQNVKTAIQKPCIVNADLTLYKYKV